MNKILLFLFLITYNLAQSQNFYLIENSYYNNDGLKVYIKNVRKNTNVPNMKPIFKTNRIEKHGDSIINFGNVTFVPKNFKEEKIYGLLNNPLPDFMLEKYKGGTLSSNDLKGKPTIINLWFTTCPPCIAEMPDLNTIKETYQDKLNYVGITFNDRGKVYDFFKTHIFNFDILINGREYINTLGNSSYPKIILIDKDNIVRYIDFGIPVLNNNAIKKQHIEEFYKIIEKI